MAQIFTVQLTQGNSEGGYAIYYNQIGTSFYATATTTNTLTQNLSYSTLSAGIEIAIPNSANQIIILGLSPDCNNTLIYPVTPIDEPPQEYNFPILCFGYGENVISEYLTFTPNGVSPTTGRGSWSSGSYLINWNLTAQRWELTISSLLTFISTYTSNDGVPDGTWTAIGSNVKNYLTNVTRGSCINTGVIISFTSQQTSTSCFSNPTSTNCNGSITINNTTGGFPPYQYSINGNTFQLFPTFTNLCAGNYTITVKDSQGNVATNTVQVTSGSQPVSYNISLNNRSEDGTQNDTTSNKTSNWQLVFPTFDAGTTFTIYLIFTSTSTISEPGQGTITPFIEVYLNNEIVDPLSTNTSSFTVQRPDCQQNQTIQTTNKTFVIDYQVGDIIKGSCSSNLTITNPQSINSCATKLENSIILNTQVSSVVCSCCNIQPFAQTTLIENSITAKTNVNQPLNEFCLSYGTTCWEATHPIFF